MTMPPVDPVGVPLVEPVRTLTNAELEREYQARAKVSGMTSPKALAAGVGAGAGAGVGVGVGAALAEIVAAVWPLMADHQMALNVLFTALIAGGVAAATTWFSASNKLKTP